MHGIAKEEWDKSHSVWGQYKHRIVEGYLTVKYPDGIVNYFQNKNNEHNGYGIETYNGGEEYRGEYKNNYIYGYGLMKYPNNDEYDGQWENLDKHGEGVFKDGSTGRVERRLYEWDDVKEVLEVIEQGH